MLTSRSLVTRVCPHAPFLLPRRAVVSFLQIHNNGLLKYGHRHASAVVQKRPSKSLTRVKLERKMREKEMQKSIPRQLVPPEVI